MNPALPYEPDDEIIELIARWQDGRLDGRGKQRLEQRLRAEPAALKYGVDCLRFDSEMREVLLPPLRVEWSETWRLATPSGLECEVQRSQSIRFGRTTAGARHPARRRRWWLAGLGGAVIVAASLIPFLGGRTLPPSPLELRNADFEATDLTYIPGGSNSALVEWQDYFTTPGSTLVEIARVSGGKIFAKSGRNVARLTHRNFLTQRLRRQNEEPLLARPGLKVVVSGWAYVQAGLPPYGLRGALRFVVSSKPGMIQYEATSDQASLVNGGWQPFRLQMLLPENLALAASDIDPDVPTPPRLDLNGHELTLSLDSRCLGGVLLLDALKIEEFPPGKSGTK